MERLLFRRFSFVVHSREKAIDNTTPDEISAWLKAIERIRPSEVMIYTISRDTPEGASLNKVPLSELKAIASLVDSMGIRTQVSG
jgi:hypothetical protein